MPETKVTYLINSARCYFNSTSKSIGCLKVCKTIVIIKIIVRIIKITITSNDKIIIMISNEKFK